MGAVPKVSERPLTDAEISLLAGGIDVNFHKRIAVEYLGISQIEANNIYSDCREKVHPTNVEYLHLWKNRQCPQKERRKLLEILEQLRKKDWILLNSYDFLNEPTAPADKKIKICHCDTCNDNARHVGTNFCDSDFGACDMSSSTRRTTGNLLGASSSVQNTSFQPTTLHDPQQDQICLGDEPSAIGVSHSNNSMCNSRDCNQPVSSTYKGHQRSTMPSQYTPSSSSSFRNLHRGPGQHAHVSYDTDQTFPIFDNCPSGTVQQMPAVPCETNANPVECHCPMHNQPSPSTRHQRRASHNRRTYNPPHEYEMNEMHSLPASNGFRRVKPREAEPDYTQSAGYFSLDKRHRHRTQVHGPTSISAPATPQATSTRRYTTSDGHMCRPHSETFTFSSQDSAQQYLQERSDSLPSGSRRKRVLITYAKDDTRLLREVLRLVDYLKTKFDVNVDIAEQKELARDKMGWIDSSFQNADKIIVVISPEYFRVIGGDESSTDTVLPKETFTQEGLNTRYIHKLMQIEYLRNGCRNERFMPLIFPKFGATLQHVPSWLQNTLIYTWPSHSKTLSMHIKDCYWYDDILEFVS